MERDKKIEALVQTMADCCDITGHAEKLKAHTIHYNAVLGTIMQQVVDCAYFIRDYSSDKSFGMLRSFTIIPGAGVHDVHLNQVSVR